MVRTAPDKDQTIAKRLSIAMALVVGLVAFGGWWWVNRETDVRPIRRTVTDVDVTWVCSKDPRHVTRAPGGYASVPCATCESPTYMSFTFVCPVHQQKFRALVKMSRKERDGIVVERIDSYHIEAPGESWRQGDGRVRCPLPDCNEPAQFPRPEWKLRSTPPPQP